MSNEAAQMKMFMEKAAAEHLAQFNNLLVNGITGTDQLYLRHGEHRALSALYGYLLGMEMDSFNDNVNALDQMQQNRQDIKISETVDALLNWFRCGELIKLQAKSLVIDQANPNKIPDRNYWKTMEENFSEREEMFEGIQGNLMLVLTSVYGENWNKKLPNVDMCYEFYTNYWKAHQTFK